MKPVQHGSTMAVTLVAENARRRGRPGGALGERDASQTQTYCSPPMRRRQRAEQRAAGSEGEPWGAFSGAARADGQAASRAGKVTSRRQVLSCSRPYRQSAARWDRPFVRDLLARRVGAAFGARSKRATWLQKGEVRLLACEQVIYMPCHDMPSGTFALHGSRRASNPAWQGVTGAGSRPLRAASDAVQRVHGFLNRAPPEADERGRHDLR